MTETNEAPMAAPDVAGELVSGSEPERLPLRFTVDRSVLRAAWQRVDPGQEDASVTLVLAASEVVLNTARGAISASATVPLHEACGLPAGRVLTLRTKAELFSGVLCNARLHSFSQAGSETAAEFWTVESVGDLTLDGPAGALETACRLRFGGDGMKITWPFLVAAAPSRDLAAAPPDVPALSARELARLLKIAHGLVLPRNDETPNALIAVDGGQIETMSRLGLRLVRAGLLGATKLILEPADGNWLAGVLGHHGGDCAVLADADEQVLSSAQAAYVIALPKNKPLEVTRITHKPDLIAITLDAETFHGRLPGLLAQATGPSEQVELALTGTTAPTLTFSLPVDDGEASLRLEGAWALPSTAASDPSLARRGSVSLRALRKLADRRAEASTLEWRWREGSLAIKQAVDGGDIHSYIPFKALPPQLDTP